MNPSPITGRFSDHANAIRGMAALAVVAGHVRGFFLADYQDLAAPGVFEKAVYLLTGFGHEAVMVFFVLSGFLVGGSALRGSWSWGDYLSRRLFRLHLVLIPALLLTGLVDQLALLLPNGGSYYLHPLPHYNDVPFVERMSGAVLLGNLAFLQTIAVPVYGSNSPLWSLAFEFWYYLLFPLMVRCGRGPVKEKAACAAIFGALVYLLPVNLLAGGLIWLLGVAVRKAPRPQWNGGWVSAARWTSGGLFVLILLAARLKRLPEGSGDYPVGLGFALWFYWLYVTPAGGEAAWKPWYRWWSARLAGCSYSVYAMHFPLVVLIRVVLPPGVWQPEPGSYLLILAIGLVVCAVGYLFSLATEAHTDRVREWASDWLLGKGRAA